MHFEKQLFWLWEDMRLQQSTRGSRRVERKTVVFYEREDGDGRWGDMDGQDTLKGEQNLSIS